METSALLVGPNVEESSVYGLLDAPPIPAFAQEVVRACVGARAFKGKATHGAVALRDELQHEVGVVRAVQVRLQSGGPIPPLPRRQAGGDMSHNQRLPRSACAAAELTRAVPTIDITRMPRSIII